MKRIVVLCLMLLLVSCTTPQQPQDTIEDAALPEITPTILPSKYETIVKDTPTAPEGTYSLPQLQADIDNITLNHFTWAIDEADASYHDGNTAKFSSIKSINIVSSQEFYNTFSAPHWQEYERYLNMSDMRLLHTPLERNRFKSDQAFKNYNRDRTRVERVEREEVFNVEHGKVMEYQQLNWKYTNGNYFDGVWTDTLLIYKIYCSPNYVVFLRPEWTDVETGFVATLEEVHNNWNMIVEKQLRPVFLNRSNEILSRCPVTKEFFDTMPEKKYDAKEELTYEDAANLRYFWDLDINVVPHITFDEDEEVYVLEHVNVTFMNTEEFALYGALNVDIEAAADNNDKESFVDDKSVSLLIDLNQNISRRYETADDITFKNNVTVDVYLYRWWEGPLKPVRPTTFTFDVNGTLLKKGEIEI